MLPQFNCLIGELEKFGHLKSLLSLQVENLLKFIGQGSTEELLLCPGYVVVKFA